MTYIDQDGKSHDDMKAYSESVKKQRGDDKMSDNIPNDMPSKIKVGRCKTNKPYIYFLRVPDDCNYDKLKLPEYIRKETADKKEIELLEIYVRKQRDIDRLEKKVIDINDGYEKILQPIRERLIAEAITIWGSVDYEHRYYKLITLLKETLALADKEIK